MYRREKTQERSYPSFSSTILEQIERSIEEADKHSCDGVGGDQLKLKNQTNRAMENEDISILARACVMEYKKVGDKAVSAQRRRQCYDGNKLVHDHNNDHDIMSSESVHCYTSCFASLMPKPPKPVRSTTETEKNSTHTRTKVDQILKSGALKICSKVKQPVNFLNSLFTAKKSKSSSSIPAVQSLSTCPSAFSYPRSCLRKNSSPSCRSEKLGNEGIKKTVRFHPVDENGRSCGQKRLYEPEEQEQKDVDSWKVRWSPKRKMEEGDEVQMSEKTQRVEKAAREEFMRHYRQIQLNNCKFTLRDFLCDVEQVDDDAVFCSSSDRFELENLE
ncbi:hypothetical protein FEM48_Zijuj07G0108300 [Ziziphus jujuba var. spinosa]|uniref:Protein BIG GRAIN 1-like B n=1 Tax=Ziziphus jujuba var. spinosa TaxID=714518 RepID=A0A978V472_ZIZJJ|nr:hypothetical protein FEM48_Zijuj07G0108300 [Ziziphus jujuba var. spinosa]